MLLRFGIVVVAVLLAIFFLNSLLEIIISILMIGIGILVLAVLGGIIFSSTEQLDDYRKYFQMKIKELKLKLRIKSMEYGRRRQEL